METADQIMLIAAMALGVLNFVGSLVLAIETFKEPVLSTTDIVSSIIGLTPIVQLLVYGIYQGLVGNFPILMLDQTLRFMVIICCACLFVIRAIGTIIWLCMLPSRNPDENSTHASIAAMVDILWTVVFAAYLTRKFRFLTAAEQDAASVEQKDNIPYEKADRMVELRRQRYGASFLQSWDDEATASQTSVMYAASGDNLPIDASQDSHLAGFLRCRCCVDLAERRYAGTGLTDTELESTSSLETDYGRQAFLHRDPVSSFTGFKLDTELPYRAHQLCLNCVRVCRLMTAYLINRKTGALLHRALSQPEQRYCRIQHYTDPLQLFRNSDRCHLCALLWNYLNDEQQVALVPQARRIDTGLEGHADGHTYYAAGGRNHIWLVMVDDVMVPHYNGLHRPRRWAPSIRGFPFVEIEDGSEFARPFDIKLPRSLFSSGPIVVPAGSHTGSPIAVKLVVHALSKRQSDERQLPTRLLDLEHIDSGKIQLCTCDSSIQSDAKYVALSHCWGTAKNAPMVTLRAENFEEYTKVGIELRKLTKTFQEAVQFTAALGFRYIWIDSLCIIQGSTEDFNIEGARMADVYRGAACTIAANSAWNGSEGLFRTQNPLSCSPCLIGTLDDKSYSEHVQPIYLVPRTQTEDMRRTAELTLSRLHRRGWCLQEYYLSTAIVHFADSQIYVATGNQLRSANKQDGRYYSPAVDEIQEAFGYATSPEHQHQYRILGQLDTDNVWDNMGLIKARRQMSNLAQKRLGQLTGGSWENMWWAAVNEFSTRDFTNYQDKLIAVRGLATVIREQWPGLDKHEEEQTLFERCSHLPGAPKLPLSCVYDYMVGIWTNRPFTGLLWYVDLGADRKKPKDYRAPSWSWASVEGIITNDSLELDPRSVGVEILDHHMIFDEGQAHFANTPWLLDDVRPGSGIALRGTLQGAELQGVETQTGEERYYAARHLIEHSTSLWNHDNLAGQFSSVSTVPEVGPLCHKLIDPQTKQHVGWFIPDVAQSQASNTAAETLRHVVCLKFDVKLVDSKHQRDPYTGAYTIADDDPRLPTVIRGLVLVPAGSDNANHSGSASASSDRLEVYRRVGYFELDSRVDTQIHTTRHFRAGRMKGNPRAGMGIETKNMLVVQVDNDPNGFFRQSTSKDILLI